MSELQMPLTTRTKLKRERCADIFVMNCSSLSVKKGSRSMVKRKVKIACMVAATLALFGIVGEHGPVLAKKHKSKNDFIRAFWVQAFEDGLKTPEQIDQLIEEVKKAHMNTIIAQVSRRHDAYYHSDVLPFTEDPDVPEGFDPLGYLLEKGKEEQIEIHAWVIVGPMWHSVYGGEPQDPNHIWNKYGPNAPADETWATEDFHGTTPYWQPYLDLAHPGSRDHVVNVVTDLVKNYAVDGVHLDYSRCPEDNNGYNPTALARFHEETGRSDRPQPTDEQWIKWKTDQVDSLVHRVYVEMMSENMDVDLTAAVLSWGVDDPRTTDWWDMDPVQRAHQNWKKWVQEGYLDYAYVINYDEDADPRRAERLDQWIEWQKDLPRTRGLLIGPALYMNQTADSIHQIHRALAPSPAGNTVEGVSLYVYNVWSNDGLPREELIDSLSTPTEHNDGNPPFTDDVESHAGDWKKAAHGHLFGTLEGQASNEEIIVRRGKNGQVIAELVTDANGHFVATDLQPGHYVVQVKGKNEKHQVNIQKQAVTSVRSRR